MSLILGLECGKDLLLFFNLTIEVLDLAFEPCTLDREPEALALACNRIASSRSGQAVYEQSSYRLRRSVAADPAGARGAPCQRSRPIIRQINASTQKRTKFLPLCPAQIQRTASSS